MPRIIDEESRRQNCENEAHGKSKRTSQQNKDDKSRNGELMSRRRVKRSGGPLSKFQQISENQSFALGQAAGLPATHLQLFAGPPNISKPTSNTSRTTIVVKTTLRAAIVSA